MHRSGKRVVRQEVPLDRAGDDRLKANQLPSEAPTPSAEAIRHEEAALVHRALALLAEKDRDILVWRNLENLSFEAIAERIEGNASQARKSWLRAVERLRVVLDSLPRAPGTPSPPAGGEPAAVRPGPG